MVVAITVTIAMVAAMTAMMEATVTIKTSQTLSDNRRGENSMFVKVNRDGVCYGDDAIDKSRTYELDDSITVKEFVEKLGESYLPRQQDGIWYLSTYDMPCIIVWSSNEERVVAEVPGQVLAKLSSKDPYWYFHYDNMPKAYSYIMSKIKKTDGIEYDKKFFDQLGRVD